MMRTPLPRGQCWILAALLMFAASGARAQFCIGNYTDEVEIDAGDTQVLSFNALNNVHVLFSDKEGPVLLRMYANEEFGDISEWYTLARDEKKQQMTIDASDFTGICLYAIIPINQYLRAITAEGSATINIGPLNITEFAFVVNNGNIRSSSPMYADSLQLVINGNGNILFQNENAWVGRVFSSIIGRGNITMTGGEVQVVEVKNGGTGNTAFGTVTQSMNVQLAGSGTTSTLGSPDLVVEGVSQPVNYVKVEAGECKVKSEDPNFKPCTTSKKSLGIAG